jgi:hypothetical protein
VVQGVRPDVEEVALLVARDGAAPWRAGAVEQGDARPAPGGDDGSGEAGEPASNDNDFRARGLIQHRPSPGEEFLPVETNKGRRA